ncbi:TolC family outer membrane protein [Rhodoligotrophos defluvii]|uniref:TolC family outer membrane protein n=1 Tax=Rhodoligotrophos defluvii TaxID=2561934 RepID=UPI0010C9C740|nr:TolC family outer membrane protein [Rhodoligotrophos defluvii]
MAFRAHGARGSGQFSRCVSPCRLKAPERTGRFRLALLLLAAAVPLALPVSPLKAETLREALAKAYTSNPQLLAQRAQQRSTDEEVPQALAGWRPTVIAESSYGFLSATQRSVNQFTGNRQTTSFTTDPGTFNIQLSQPIFNGFQTVNQVRAAEANVMAQRGELARIEQQVLLQAVNAYMAVIEDRRVLDLRRKNVQVLREQLRSTQARFEVGDNTRTDVAQAQARLAEAQSALTRAEADLAISVGDYIQVIGQAPGSLVFPEPADDMVPRTIDGAIQLAELNNPQVITAEFNEKVRGFQVGVSLSTLLPSASLAAGYNYSANQSPSTFWGETFSVTAQVQVPIYQGGGEYAAVRQAKQLRNQAQLLIADTRRTVREAVVQAWNNLVAARDSIRSQREAVRAQQLAYQGVRLEAEAGTRTTLDVLNAEQELLNAQVNLVAAEVNTITASYALVAAVGRLNAVDLKLPVQIYDPRIYYNKVRNLWFGLSTPNPD